MRKTAALIGLLMTWSMALRGQLLLHQGDTYTYAFAAGQIPSVTIVGVFPGQNPSGGLNFTMSGMDTGDLVRGEMFESDPSGAPSATGAAVGLGTDGSCRSDFAWQDQQGAIRITMLTGSATLESFKIGYLLPTVNPGGTPRFAVYELTVVPVPEPSVTALGLAGAAAVFCLFRRGQGEKSHRGLRLRG